MANPAISCGKCGAAMEAGSLMAVWGSRNMAVESWVAGIVEKNWLTRAAEVKGKRQMPVTAWHCPACGFVEMYAK